MLHFIAAYVTIYLVLKYMKYFIQILSNQSFWFACFPLFRHFDSKEEACVLTSVFAQFFILFKTCIS